TLEAAQADRDVGFEAASFPVVDTAANSIFVGLDSGIKTGDELTYKKGASTNTGIGGLTDGSNYFAHAEDGGKIKLYDSKEHADAGGDSGLVDLTSGATGTGHKLKHALSTESIGSAIGSLLAKDVDFDAAA